MLPSRAYSFFVVSFLLKGYEEILREGTLKGAHKINLVLRSKTKHQTKEGIPHRRDNRRDTICEGWYPFKNKREEHVPYALRKEGARKKKIKKKILTNKTARISC